MNSTLRDAQAPSHRECLLPSMARTHSVTQVTPAKKITFLKRGDPQFSGVRLAVHQRTFKSFGTLMDELSQRVPLSFGVRSVTTPRGLHGLSALEQLEDGGYYLCSDKKLPKTPSGPGWPQGRRPSAQQSRDVEGQCEAPGTSFSRRAPKAPRRVMLIKNGDPRFQQTVVLSHQNTKSLMAFLNKASELLLFPVKQVYTPSGKKVNSLKALLHSPSVLVCAGHESFRTPAMEGARKTGTEMLSGQTSRNKNRSWGPKAQQSVIHSRSRSSSRPQVLSLLSERSGPCDTLVSLHRTWMGPAPDRLPQDTPDQPGPLVASDDVEKKVHLNEDGSLSVEMKVRFHLLGDDLLLWSRRVGRASALTAASEEAPFLGEEGNPRCVWEGHPRGSSDPGAQGQNPCEAGCKEAFGRGLWWSGSRYEIWTNPLYTVQGEAMAPQRRSGLTQHSHSTGTWSQGVTGMRKSSQGSLSPASSDRPRQGTEPIPSCCSRSQAGSVGSCDLYQASMAASQRRAGREAGGTPRAGEGPGPEAAGLGSRQDHRQEPRTQDVARTHSDSSASARSHDESSERRKWHQGHPSKVMTVASLQKTTLRGEPRYPTMSPSSLRNKDPQAKENGKDTGHPQAKGGSGTGLSRAEGHFGSGDSAGGCFPPSTCTSTTGGKRMQESRASALSSARVSGLSRGAQRACRRQKHNQRETRCLLHSPVSRRIPGPPSVPRVRPAPHLSGNSSAAGNRASQDPELPFSASLLSQDAQGASSAPLTPVSNSDWASNFYPPYSPSVDTEGDPEFRGHSPAPTHSSSFKSQPDGLGKKEGVGIPTPRWPLGLPVGLHEAGKPEAHRGDCCSQMGTSLVHRTPGGKTQAAQVTQPQGSQGLCSEACVVCSRYCPTPPGAQPSAKKHPSRSGSPSNGDYSADWGTQGAEPGEGKLDSHPQPSGSQSGTRGLIIRVPRSSSPNLGPRPGRMFQGQVTGAGEGQGEEEDDGGMTPGTLPQASPEAVVREWLSNIAEEPMPVKYEMVNDSTDESGDGQKGPMEVPAEGLSLEGMEERTQARQPSLERATGEEAEPGRAPPMTSNAGPLPGEGLPHSGVSKAPKEAGAGEGTAEGCGIGQHVLPHRVSASIQIMKVLMGSKRGRPSSLPEVSCPVGRRLSRSAQALITCLARLHFFDEDLGSPTSKVRFTDSLQYQELLSTLQTLWPGYGLGRGELDSDLQELHGCQALPGVRSHTVTEDFTPTSSSGVDVGSGSGGSGEGSGPCAVDCILVPEGINLPLKIPNQRPDSRTSENPVDLGDQQPSGSTASSSSHAWTCAAGKGGAEGSSRQQMSGSNLDRVAENPVPEEEVQTETTKEEREGAESRGPDASGFPEGESIMAQESSAAGSQDREGALEEESEQDEGTGRDAASATLHPPGRRETWTEALGNLRGKDSNAHGSQSGPSAEPDLEKLPMAAETNYEQTQAKFTQGAGQKGTAMAHRASLDPHLLWVSKLLGKMEKVFMAHLASATAELQAHWRLQSKDLLDQMVAEMQLDVGRRLRDSTEKELQKIQSRAGGKAPRPPKVALRWEMSLQTEQRRRHLQGLHNLSAFSDQIHVQGSPSSSLEDVPTLTRIPETQLGGGANGEEFCPCDTCVRKKMTPLSPKNTMDVASVPIKEAFDLKHILQKKKEGCAIGKMAEVAPENTGTEPLQRDPSGAGTVQGADGVWQLRLDQGPGVEEGEEGESSQTLGRGEVLGRGGKGVAIQKIGRNKDPCIDCHLEAVEWEKQGLGDKGEKVEEGSWAEDSVEGEALGGSDRSLGRQNDGADPLEAQECEGEGQPESRGRNQGEKGSPQFDTRQGQLGEISGHSNPVQEGRPTPPLTPGRDAPYQRSSPQTGPFSSCNTSSLGNCSQQSQEGSEEEPSNADMRTTGDESKGVSGPKRKVTGIYPESSTSEQEGSLSGSRTPEQGTDEVLTPETGAGQGSDLEAKKVVKSFPWTEVRFKNLTMDRTDGFGQDDLDF